MCLLFPRICCASAREPYYAPSNGAFPSSQVVKAPPRRGKAVWSAARFVCRMTLCACRSSSRKTRYAIFVGALKNKKALAHPSRKDFCAAKEIRELKSNPARRVPLRCVSRGRARARTEISPQWEIHNGKFPVNKWQRAHRALCKKAFVHTQFAPYQRLTVLRKT